MADAQKAAQVVEGALKDAELEWESPEPGTYVVKLPGTRKLSTTVSLIVGRCVFARHRFSARRRRHFRSSGLCGCVRCALNEKADANQNQSEEAKCPHSQNAKPLASTVQSAMRILPRLH